MLLQAVTRRAQRALLSRLAGGKGNGGGSGGGVPLSSSAAETTTSPPTPTPTPTPTTPPYSPPKTPPLRDDEVLVPTLNFWESPTRPGEWKISQQYVFLAGAGALSLWATVKALSAENNSGGEGGGNGGGKNGGEKNGKREEAGESKVTGGMSPAKRGMVEAQERSPVKKQVP